MQVLECLRYFFVAWVFATLFSPLQGRKLHLMDQAQGQHILTLDCHTPI